MSVLTTVFKLHSRLVLQELGRACASPLLIFGYPGPLSAQKISNYTSDAPISKYRFINTSCLTHMWRPAHLLAAVY
jgi:hypothetical protein